MESIEKFNDYNWITLLRYLSLVVMSYIITYHIENSIVALIILLYIWSLFFKTLNIEDVIIFIIASIFFLFQNYMVLKEGVFVFVQQDILLMPFYEPFLWGYYLLSLKFFFNEKKGAKLTKYSFIGLIVTGLAFTLFIGDKLMLLIASSISTIILYYFFHEKNDILFSIYTLIIGLLIEIIGTHVGLWYYASYDIFRIPLWSITMWLSAGLLGRNFLFPLSIYIKEKLF